MRRRFNVWAILALLVAVMSGWIQEPAAALTPEEPEKAALAAPANATSVQQQAAPTQLVAERKKPWYKSRAAKITAGGAGAGAVVGAIAGGKKGAAIGAISGGAAGYIYDRKTRKTR